MARRLKDWNTRNAPDSGDTVKDFMIEAIEVYNVRTVISVDEEGKTVPEGEQIASM